MISSQTSKKSKVARVLERWRDNEQAFFEECLCTTQKDPNQPIVRFNFAHKNPERKFGGQLKLIKMVQQLREAQMPERIIGLKPRQIGLTTVSTGLMYARTALRRNVVTAIASNDLTSAEAIHEKFTTFWENTHPAFRPMRARTNRRELVLRNPRRLEQRKPRETGGLHSKIFVESAKKITIGRSQTVHNFHGSEVAKWESGHERALSVMNAVPKKPGTLVILESTADGVGNFFHDMWKLTTKRNSIWQGFFFGWHEHEQYTMLPGSDYNAQYMTEEELQLVQKYMLTEGQITWRRYTIENDCGNDVELFRQEYPINAEEAFLTTGRSAFNQARIKLMEDTHAEAGQAMSLVVESGRSLENVNVQPAQDGPLKIFRPPMPGHMYVIGVDVAEGLEKGDWSVAQVIDVLNKEQVAVLRLHCTPDDLCALVVMLGFWYNEALLAIEKNKDGLHVVAHASHIYPNLWGEEEFDKIEKKKSQRWGWHMDEPNKRIIMHELNNFLKQMRIKLHCATTLHEMRIYQRDKNGRFGCPEGPDNFDDCVDALAIAFWIAVQESIQYGQAAIAPIGDVQIRSPLAVREAYRGAQEVDEPAEML